MTTIEILKGYGYQQRGESVWNGAGTLVWGWTCEVTPLGAERYAVEYRAWGYDQYGDPYRDEHRVLVTDLAELYQLLWGERAVFLRTARGKWRAL